MEDNHQGAVVKKRKRAPNGRHHPGCPVKADAPRHEHIEGCPYTASRSGKWRAHHGRERVRVTPEEMEALRRMRAERSEKEET